MGMLEIGRVPDFRLITLPRAFWTVPWTCEKAFDTTSTLPS